MRDVAMKELVGPYFETLSRLIRETECTGPKGEAIDVAEAFTRVRASAHAVHDRGNKLMFVGNGGSAGIASHVAVDYSKNGGLRAVAFNDGAVLTCLGNDLGYENVFAKQIEWHAREGDLLVVISSSGRSANILKAVEAARGRSCQIVTLSGFSDQNPLRSQGDVNFFVRSHQYGFVEVVHLALIHAILDLDLGWTPSHP
jgi:D-sedoheptulose 7-phosphate isomerase